MSGSLQSYFNGVGESINAWTDQNAVQAWQASDKSLYLIFEYSGNAAANAIGIYNASLPAPPLYQVFPGDVTPGWWAFAEFRTAPNRLIVSLFDGDANLQGFTTYPGADPTNFAYYLQGSGDLYYTQDSRNPGGVARALAYAGTGSNSGQWWLCWEDGDDQDFDDSVVFMEWYAPTPVSKTTWGALKKRFR